MSYRAPPIPSAFIWRRAHSFTGLFLVLFLIQHLFTNSQAALLIGEDGKGFIAAVNWIKSLPFLPAIELGLLGVPFVIHGVWGVKYLMSAKYNSTTTDGSSPSLPQYSRNHAYTWQRITSWILLIGIVAHVVHMRFLEYPSSAKLGQNEYYMVRVEQDKGLQTLAGRLGFDIYDENRLSQEQQRISALTPTEDALEAQSVDQQRKWLQAMQESPLKKKDQVIVVAKSFGLAELLLVREIFKNPIMIFLYTGLVLAACFHAFNGLWTFMISWGVTLTEKSQRGMRMLATTLMVFVSLLGLAAVWGSYWINLYS